MRFLPSASTVRAVAVTMVLFAIANRFPAIRDTVQNRGAANVFPTASSA